LPEQELVDHWVEKMFKESDTVSHRINI
jgi:hypothetical protein